MTDLVTRLYLEGDASRYAFGEGADPDICVEAADKIVRLRSLLSDCLWMVEAHEGTSDENDALVDRVRAETRAKCPDPGTDTTDNGLQRPDAA